ncbi:Holliday junction resolvase [Candidatus Paracaedimonas acanthamoebae]|nr:Holliday junction resolvase [Candidatus Paracaedimonas acanthamoebae]
MNSLKSLKNNKNRLMGLDVGTKTIGLALSDTTWTIATPLQTLERKKFKQDITELKTIMDKYYVSGLVIGFPKNMDGSEGPRCQSIKQFSYNLLTEIDIHISFWDERLSTVAVTRALLEADVSRKRRQEVVDKMAASYILQGVLDTLTR